MNREITVPHPSGNPELETFRTVNGHIYIEVELGGDYKRGFDILKGEI